MAIWTVEGTSWPPIRRPEPPYGVIQVEVMRSCPLRACYEASPGYQRRVGFAARVGIAFHRALERLLGQPALGTNTDMLTAHAERLFHEELQRQRNLAASNPREAATLLDRSVQEREARALESLSIIIHRLLHEGAFTPSGQGRRLDMGAEVEVQSRDGILKGRIDTFRRDKDGGLCIVDYKAALRPDLPQRYERQMQLYAWMWHEAFGEWPSRAEVHYPFTGDRFPIEVDPETCTEVAREALTLIDKVRNYPVADLASPGDVCKVCDFRPWCVPFWRWQAEEKSLPAAMNRAWMGLEGQVTKCHREGGDYILVLRWRNNLRVKAVLDGQRFPHLSNVTDGLCVRLLEFRLVGAPPELRAIPTETAEIFLVS